MPQAEPVYLQAAACIRSEFVFCRMSGRKSLVELVSQVQSFYFAFYVLNLSSSAVIPWRFGESSRRGWGGVMLPPPLRGGGQAVTTPPGGWAGNPLGASFPRR